MMISGFSVDPDLPFYLNADHDPPDFASQNKDNLYRKKCKKPQSIFLKTIFLNMS